MPVYGEQHAIQAKDVVIVPIVSFVLYPQRRKGPNQVKVRSTIHRRRCCTADHRDAYLSGAPRRENARLEDTRHTPNCRSSQVGPQNPKIVTWSAWTMFRGTEVLCRMIPTTLASPLVEIGRERSHAELPPRAKCFVMARTVDACVARSFSATLVGV